MSMLDSLEIKPLIIVTIKIDRHWNCKEVQRNDQSGVEAKTGIVMVLHGIYSGH